MFVTNVNMLLTLVDISEKLKAAGCTFTVSSFEKVVDISSFCRFGPVGSTFNGDKNLEQFEHESIVLAHMVESEITDFYYVHLDKQSQITTAVVRNICPKMPWELHGYVFI